MYNDIDDDDRDNYVNNNEFNKYNGDDGINGE